MDILILHDSIKLIQSRKSLINTINNTITTGKKLIY